MMAVAWMPLAWLAVLHLGAEQRRPRRWIAILAFALGMSILGGFPQPSLVVFVSVCLLAGLLVAVPPRAGALALRYTAAACVLGILLASVQFIPTTQLTDHSVAQVSRRLARNAAAVSIRRAWCRWCSRTTTTSSTPSQFKGPGDLTFLYHVLQHRRPAARDLRAGGGAVARRALRDHGGASASAGCSATRRRPGAACIRCCRRRSASACIPSTPTAC